MTDAIEIKTGSPQEVAATVAAIIRNQPDRWRQGSWFNGEWAGYWADADKYVEGVTVEQARESLNPGRSCGSTACVAGWAAILTAPPGTRLRGTHLRLPEGKDAYTSVMAAEALGLSGWDGDWLFDGGRVREEVLAALDSIAAGDEMVRIVSDDYDEDDDSESEDEDDDDEDPCDCHTCHAERGGSE
jgi:hypothetical protein